MKLLMILFVSATAGCTAAAPATEPMAYEISVDIRMPSGEAHSHTRTPLTTSRESVYVISNLPKAPYVVKVQAAPCGEGARFTYSLTRLDTEGDQQAAIPDVLDLSKLGLPPSGAPPAPSTTAATPEHRVEGARIVARGGETVLADGAWSDGEPYSLRVTVR